MSEICQHCGAPATTNGATGQPRCCDQCDNRPMSCDCANRTLRSESERKAKLERGYYLRNIVRGKTLTGKRFETFDAAEAESKKRGQSTYLPVFVG